MICLQKHAKGQVLLDMVSEHLDLAEPDYFGLQFVDHDFESTSDGWVNEQFHGL